MLDLEPYRTQAVDYLFYFPWPGRFAHFPVHVAKNEKFIAAAQSVMFDVVEKPSRLDSWEYVSQNGTSEEVLALLGRENYHALDLEKIAFRMKAGRDSRPLRQKARDTLPVCSCWPRFRMPNPRTGRKADAR